MKKRVHQAVIFAGGRGERLAPFTDTTPKPLYPIDGVPFISRLIMQLKSFGIDKILILLGYLSEQVEEEVGDGSKFGVDVEYDVTPVSYETIERMNHAKDKLEDEFMILYCDNYCPINYHKLEEDFYQNDALIQLTIYDNKDNYTKSNIKIDDSNKVILYDKKREMQDLSGVEIGYMLVKKEILNYVTDEKKLSDIFPRIIELNKMYATITSHRYYSIGSFSRMNLTEEFFKPKHVVFLDRDGTINEKAPKACYIEKKENFIWLPGAMEAIKKLNDNGVITILITNQPGIARGNFTLDVLNDIHNKMQSDLASIGAKIDYIYYCPHNWFDGCDCRKPKPGMLYQAQKDLSLNLEKCMLFGDDERDLEAAANASVPAKLITEEYPLIKAVDDYLEVLKDDCI